MEQATLQVMGQPRGRLAFEAIHSRRMDWGFYLGAAGLGWFYAALVLAGAALAGGDPSGSLATFSLAGRELTVTLPVLVGGTWALLFSGPHVWSTLARTVLDPDEWRVRRRELLLSFAWFVAGPAAVLLPYLWNAAARESAGPLLSTTAPFLLFVLFHRLWGYYHVARQHWGFFLLYKHKAGDADARWDRIDGTFFALVFSAPIVLLVTAPHGLSEHVLPLLKFPAAQFVHNATLALTTVAAVLYGAAQLRRAARGERVSAGKLALLLLFVPLVYLAVLHPLLALFFLPLVISGHNLQYQAFVWRYGREKYVRRRGDERRYRVARLSFRNPALYFALGVLFTALLYYGPLHEALNALVGTGLDRLGLEWLAVAAGAASPERLGLGEQVLAALALGWASQHYYLDSKIWHYSQDAELRRFVGLAE